jgi:hypothetical protein
MSGNQENERSSYTYNGLSLTMGGENYEAVKAFASKHKLKQKELIQNLIQIVLSDLADKEKTQQRLEVSLAMAEAKVTAQAEEREEARLAARAARLRDKRKQAKEAMARLEKLKNAL